MNIGQGTEEAIDDWLFDHHKILVKKFVIQAEALHHLIDK